MLTGCDTESNDASVNMSLLTLFFYPVTTRPRSRLIPTYSVLMCKLHDEAGGGLTLSDLPNPFTNPALVSNETVLARPAHLISILPASARLLLIG